MVPGVYLTDRQVRTARVLAKISKLQAGKKYFPVCVRETAGNKGFWAHLDLELAFALC